MKKVKILIMTAMLFSLGSCKKFLDIVPDNVATIESAFTLRATAERYLFTCYSWMPAAMNLNSDPGSGYWGGELWGIYPANTYQSFLYSRDDQGVTNPRLNYWMGQNGGKAMFTALRDCNVFLENISKVPDITEQERNRWIAEVKFLKAYYHFFLVRMYGPIPLMKENLPISAGPEEVQTARNPVDECFEYISQLLTEAVTDLPLQISDTESELGRITAPAAAALKAKVLVFAASPLYNGNADYAGFKDKDGTSLFNPAFDANKWKLAADAAKEAIDLSHSAGIQLYYYQPGFGAMTVSDTTRFQLNVRNSIAERWNSETIWADPNNAPAQGVLTPVVWDPTKQPNTFNNISGSNGPSIEYTEIFYTENGVPIDEDKTWDYANRYKLEVAKTEDRFNIRNGYTTAKMHFDRENRFYADLGFDGGIWYGQSRFDDKDPFYLQAKFGQHTGYVNPTVHTPTGYFAKKRINWQNVTSSASSYSVVWYPAPLIRLADLYLLYAEALNESAGPGPEVYQYLNLIRTRAGLPTVQTAWTNFSKNPTKHTSKDGLRQIIHREREIELTFEGQRFWDMKRWKRAVAEFSKPISGWNVLESANAQYYTPRVLFQQQFRQKNYLDVIRESTILNNPKLVQNPGW